MAEKTGWRDKLVLVVLVLLLLVGGVWRAVEHGRPQAQLTQPLSEEVRNEQPEVLELITVHAVGAVNNPGIYHLPAGSRIYELIDMCGGFTGEADQVSLNQARPLIDGEQIYIHKTGEAPAAASGASDNAKININRASAKELTALPGIGDTRAQQIIAHRESQGFFTDIRDITDVSGIGEATFNNIADLITIY